MLKTFISSLLHAFEFLVVVGVAYLLLNFFNLNSEMTLAVTGALVAFFVKFTRSAENSPVGDYVNRDYLNRPPSSQDPS